MSYLLKGIKKLEIVEGKIEHQDYDGDHYYTYYEKVYFIKISKRQYLQLYSNVVYKLDNNNIRRYIFINNHTEIKRIM